MESTHRSHIHMAGGTNNNRMESSSGNTVRHREKVTRSLKKDDSSHLIGLRLYHNHVRPHLRLPDGQTPSEAAGIRIEGDNKWKTIIQAAAKFDIWPFFHIFDITIVLCTQFGTSIFLLYIALRHCRDRHIHRMYTLYA